MNNANCLNSAPFSTTDTTSLTGLDLSFDFELYTNPDSSRGMRMTRQSDNSLINFPATAGCVVSKTGRRSKADFNVFIGHVVNTCQWPSADRCRPHTRGYYTDNS